MILNMMLNNKRMTRYSVQPRDRIFVKGHELLLQICVNIVKKI